MDPLAKILSLPQTELLAKGLVHTPQEIFQQPQTWRQTHEELTRLAPELKDFLQGAGVFAETRDRPAVLLIGAGSSDYVGLTVAPLLRRLWQCEVAAIPSTDLLTGMTDYLISGKRYLWISFSRSGDSSEGVALLEAALEQHPRIQHLIVCCNREGRMTHAVSARNNIRNIILDDQVNDRGLAMTSSFSNMIIAGQCLAHVQDLNSYRPILERQVVAAQKFLPAAAETAERTLATGFSRICFLGSGSLLGVAMESALKVLELTAGQIVTFSESFLGLRHGPLSAIDDDTLVVGLVSGDLRQSSYELDLLAEIREKQLTSKLLVVAPASLENSETLRNIDSRLSLDLSVRDCYRPPIDVIIGQLFGLFAALKAGLKPDTPSPRGAITRVVSQVRIY